MTEDRDRLDGTPGLVPVGGHSPSEVGGRSAEIVELRPRPSEGLVAVLEKYLERAQAGELTALAVVGIHRGGKVSTQYEREDGSSIHELTAGVTYLQHRIVSGAIG